LELVALAISSAFLAYIFGTEPIQIIITFAAALVWNNICNIATQHNGI